MSHFGRKLFGELGEVWGEFEVAWPFGLCNRAIAKMQTAMSATYALIATGKSLQVQHKLDQCTTNWRVDENKLSAQTVEAR